MAIISIRSDKKLSKQMALTVFYTDAVILALVTALLVIDPHGQYMLNAYDIRMFAGFVGVLGSVAGFVVALFMQCAIDDTS